MRNKLISFGFIETVSYVCLDCGWYFNSMLLAVVGGVLFGITLNQFALLIKRVRGDD